MKAIRPKPILIFFLCLGLIAPAFPQSSAGDSSARVYQVNHWAAGAVCGVGLFANYMGISKLLGKYDLSLAEIQALDKRTLNKIDAWSLNQDPTRRAVFEKYSDYTLWASIALPFSLLADKRIRLNGLDMVMMFLETMSLTTNIYEWSALGPNFQNRIRPVAYYDQLSYDERKTGHNRNSFYSGHVATAAASTFFMAKVYSDSHPGLGDDKYLVYAAALIPPLVLGLFRVKALKHFPSDIIVGLVVGALCGILVPEIYRVKK
ncbi:MAG: phosphatase PAP2 family protein [Candidatus Aminicenantes bacterium]|nr:phosphatase PAP2 family protein [Candidatus Aminicenantes bacterium]